MNIIDVQKQIITKNPCSYYIFTGEEFAVRQIYTNKLAEVINASVSVVPTVKDAITGMKGTLFGEKQLFVVVDDIEFSKKEDSWEKFIEICQKSNTICILIYSNIDKRTGFYQQFINTVVSFDRMAHSVLVDKLVKQYGIRLEQAEMLSETLNNNYGSCLNSCDMVKQYSEAVGITPVEAFAYLDEKGAFTEAKADIMFEFVNKVCKKDMASFDLLDKLKENEESEVVVLFNLYNNFKYALLYIGVGSDTTDITSKTGLTPFQIRLAKEVIRYWSAKQIIRAMDIIRKCEQGIKSGKIEQEIVLNYLLINLF